MTSLPTTLTYKDISKWVKTNHKKSFSRSCQARTWLQNLHLKLFPDVFTIKMQGQMGHSCKLWLLSVQSYREGHSPFSSAFLLPRLREMLVLWNCPQDVRLEKPARWILDVFPSFVVTYITCKNIILKEEKGWPFKWVGNICGWPRWRVETEASKSLQHRLPPFLKTDKKLLSCTLHYQNSLWWPENWYIWWRSRFLCNWHHKKRVRLLPHWDFRSCY